MALIFLKCTSKVNLGWNVMRKILAGDGLACRPAVYETAVDPVRFGSWHTAQSWRQRTRRPLSSPTLGPSLSEWVLRRFSQEKQNKTKENIFSCKHVSVAFEWCVGGKRRGVLSLPSMLVRWAFEVFHLAFCFLAQGADTPRVQGEESARVSSHDESLNWVEDLSLFHLQEDGFIFYVWSPFFVEMSLNSTFSATYITASLKPTASSDS